MTGSVICTEVHSSELWITYHQASRALKQVTAQLVDVSDASRLFDLEDVLDYVFQQGFVDPKWRSVTWWEDCSAIRLKACSSVQDLLASGAGSTPETALHLIVADVPQAVWVHYEYVNSFHHVTATQRIRLDQPNFKCERLAHLTNHIFAKGYLPAKTRSFVSWRGVCGKHIEESVKVEDVFSSGEGLCETKPLRLVVDFKEEVPKCVCKEPVPTFVCKEQAPTFVCKEQVRTCVCREYVQKRVYACQEYTPPICREQVQRVCTCKH